MEVSWSEVYRCRDAESAHTCFSHSLNAVFNKCFPVVIPVRPKCNGDNNKAWINSGLYISSKN